MDQTFRPGDDSPRRARRQLNGRAKRAVRGGIGTEVDASDDERRDPRLARPRLSSPSPWASLREPMDRRNSAGCPYPAHDRRETDHQQDSAPTGQSNHAIPITAMLGGEDFQTGPCAMFVAIELLDFL